MANDSVLGLAVHHVLCEAGIESPFKEGTSLPESVHPSIGLKGHMESLFSDIMEALNLDLNDSSLKDTPKRVSKMFCDEIFYGLDYKQFPACTTFPAKAGTYDEMVMVRDIEVRSMCEHHFMPFIGTASVAYIPNNHIIGLSKFARVVDFFSRRPQVQERLTQQIYYSLAFILGTLDVAIVIKAEHYCMKMRGVKDFKSDTVTSKMGGRFMERPALRTEFLSLLKKD